MLTQIIVKYLNNSRWLLLAMLWLLHGALLLGVDSPWVHPLLITHFGLFLLWQPLWRGEHRVGRSAVVFIGLAAVAELFFLNWWTVAFWLTGLFGLVGARIFVFHDRWSRLLYLGVMVYLLAVLLLWVVPNLFAAQYTMGVGSILIWYVLPVLLLAMTVLPASKELSENTQTVDFIYSLLLFMLLTLVMLGSLAFMTLGQQDYLDALLRTLFLAGLILLAFGVLWNPRFGFSGLQAIFSRYLLNVGTPFEGWLAQLTESVQREPDAASVSAPSRCLAGGFSVVVGFVLAIARRNRTTRTNQRTCCGGAGTRIAPDAVCQTSAQPHPAVAYTPAGAIDRLFLSGQTARAKPARHHAFAGCVRDRVASHPRLEKHAAIAALAYRHCTKQRKTGTAIVATATPVALPSHRNDFAQAPAAAY